MHILFYKNGRKARMSKNLSKKDSIVCKKSITFAKPNRKLKHNHYKQ